MEEKIIIKGDGYKIPKSIVISITLILLLLSSLSFLGAYSANKNYYKTKYEKYQAQEETFVNNYNEILEGYKEEFRQYTYCEHDEYNRKLPDDFHGSDGITKEAFLEAHPNAVSYAICKGYEWYPSFDNYLIGKQLLTPYDVLFGSIPLVAIIILLFIYWWISSYEIFVSDKRIFGKTAFGKRVDLPVDSISAVGTSMLKGIAVSTSSGRIVFKLIKNRDEIHSEISNLIISRQSKSNDTPAEPIVSSSTTEDLKKYKELLDMGAITQEEFDTKKKGLLNI